MKFGKINAGTISDNAIILGGAVAGGALSGGLMTLVPAQQQLVARGGMTAVGLLGAASIKGKSATGNLAKFILLGFGIKQGAELINHFAQKSISVDETSMASKFIGGMTGLACPGCEDTSAYLASPVINFEALPSPANERSQAEAVHVEAGAF